MTENVKLCVKKIHGTRIWRVENPTPQHSAVGLQQHLAGLQRASGPNGGAWSAPSRQHLAFRRLRPPPKAATTTTATTTITTTSDDDDDDDHSSGGKPWSYTVSPFEPATLEARVLVCSKQLGVISHRHRWWMMRNLTKSSTIQRTQIVLQNRPCVGCPTPNLGWYRLLPRAHWLCSRTSACGLLGLATSPCGSK